MTFKEYLDKYEKDMVVLEVYDRNGVELPDGFEVPNDVRVLTHSRLSGLFSCDIDLEANPKEEMV